MSFPRLGPVLAALAISLWLLVPTPLFGTPVQGNLDIGGSNATLNVTTLTFDCKAAVGNAPCPADYGNFLVTNGTLDFAPYDGEAGYIHNLDVTLQPINAPFMLTNFLIFSSISGGGTPDIALDLTFIFEGVNPDADCASSPAPGQVCTPRVAALVTPQNPQGISPYNLQNTSASTSTASFAVAGIVRRISTDETSLFRGVFTAQFSQPYQALLTQLAEGRPITNSYSATFSATVIPDPGTLSLVLGGGLLFLCHGLRMRRARRI